MSVNEKIKNMRRKQGITAAELAEQVNLKQSTIARYESGSIKYIPVDNLTAIAEVLGCSLDDLIKGDSRYTDTSSDYDLPKKPTAFEKDLYARISVLSPKKQKVVTQLVDSLSDL